MQSIITRYLPATNTKPARYKAFNSNRTHEVTVSIGATYDGPEARKAAVERLREQLGWTQAQGYPAMHMGAINARDDAWVFSAWLNSHRCNEIVDN